MSVEKLRGPIAWMARNAVAANLLMAGILLCGVFLGVCRVKQEVFPSFELDVVSVQVAYPGAGPAEVEQGIVLAIEEAVRGIDGVKKVNSKANEGIGVVTIEFQIDVDPQSIIADVKNAVDGIQSFPEEAEEAQVALLKRKSVVVSLIIAGEQELQVLHQIGEKARTGLMARPDVTYVSLSGVPPLEVAVEVSRVNLEKYGLTLDEVAARIRAASVDVPAGGVDTAKGELLIRVIDRRLMGEEFENIILRSDENGGVLRLGDVATVNDAYEDLDQATYYNGKPAIRLTAYRVGKETPQQISSAMVEYMETLRAETPLAVELAIWDDDSEMFRSRIGLLTRNAAQGFILVLLILYLFLNTRLAFWVAVGVPISFMGAFALLPMADVSINMISLFAFIITLGMVVDDAIIIGENVFQKMEEGFAPLEAAIRGAKEMVVPVTFAILTTMAAFAPMFFVPGVSGKFFRILPVVVVAVLVFSLIESFWVLPAHLGHQGFLGHVADRYLDWLNIPSRWVARHLETFRERIYRPVLVGALRYRYVSLAAAFSIFFVALGVQMTGHLPFSPFPKLEGNTVTAAVRLPYGAPTSQGEQVRALLEESAKGAISEVGEEGILSGLYSKVGLGPRQTGPAGGVPASGSHLVTIEMELIPSEARETSAEEVQAAWEKRTPPLPGAESVTFNANIGPGGNADLHVQLAHADQKVLADASAELVDILGGYTALTGLTNSYSGGKTQVDYTLRPEAEIYGLNSGEVSRQLRAFFFGSEALREQRGRNELRVRTRLPQDERLSEYDLELLRIRTPQGGFVPLGQIADLNWTQAPIAIEREAGKRVVDVTARLAAGERSIQPIKDVLVTAWYEPLIAWFTGKNPEQKVFDSLKAKHPGLTLGFAGSQADMMDSMMALLQYYAVAMLVVFALLAVPFKSYIQPVIVMVAIPLGNVGAVIGHLVFQYSLSMISFFGIVALSGVVVNDSLVLIDAANQKRKSGASAYEAILYGGTRRLRPILLTSLTTCFGLLPIIFERSVQARFLIPMALSLAFGILFATFVILLVVPATYMIVEDLRLFTAKMSRKMTGRPISEPEMTPSSDAANNY